MHQLWLVFVEDVQALLLELEQTLRVNTIQRVLLLIHWTFLKRLVRMKIGFVCCGRN